MIPRVNYEYSSNIPEDATFWMPSEDEIPDDEGIGNFRDVWMILNEPESEVQSVVAEEEKLIEVLDQIADSPQNYELIAEAIDSQDADVLTEGPLKSAFLQLTEGLLQESEDYPSSLRGLEVGVAGLSYALSMIGAVPVASCRGHVGDYAWSESPVVFAALDQQRVEWLQPFMREAHCGFHISPSREEFIAIDAPSIKDSSRLAHLILENFQNRPRIFNKWLDLSLIDAIHEESFEGEG
ncbi:hypothetical protein ACIGXA_14290 [Streptomyces fildesensis]|uniref:Uncharacterized protein n=1 Tax=Streptomyces fildesensis TaxID=375757 RepID=A0ABW8C5I9_9ACTN